MRVNTSKLFNHSIIFVSYLLFLSMFCRVLQRCPDINSCYYTTLIWPDIPGAWMVQTYPKVPFLVNLCEKVPVRLVTDLMRPFLNVTLWGCLPVHLQVTVVPTGIVLIFGEKKLSPTVMNTTAASEPGKSWISRITKKKKNKVLAFILLILDVICLKL